VKQRLALLQRQVEHARVSIEEGRDQWKSLVHAWLSEDKVSSGEQTA